MALTVDEVSVGSSEVSAADLCGVVACGVGDEYDGGSSSCEVTPFVVAAAAAAAPNYETY